jgi:mannose-1-phosphate guanylyltransferase
MSFVIPVILCGGSGSRLWPVTQGRPKHFMKLTGDLTLLQETASRALRLTRSDHVLIVTLSDMKEEAAAQLDELNLPVSFHFVEEPVARNTAAAVAMATLYASRHFGETASLWILPADHYIGDEAVLGDALSQALQFADQSFLVTFGIKPSRPETGYGYIQPGNRLSNNARKVALFVEKPDLETARSYLQQDDFLWNSGMVLAHVQTIMEEFNNHAPEFFNQIQATGAGAYIDIVSIPFDKAVLEKSKNVAVIPCDPDWSDIGTMDGLQLVLDNLRQAGQGAKLAQVESFLSGVPVQ